MSMRTRSEGETAKSRLRRRGGALTFLRWVGILAACCVILFFAGLILFVNHIDRARPEDNVKADAIVVLTGGDSRVTEAVRLLASGRGRRLLISGVHPETTGTMLRRVNPEGERLFDCCIDLDRNARDTIENADETRRWLAQRRFRSVIVVTSSYHMPRGLVELRRALPELKLIPYPVVPAKLQLEAWWTHPKTFRLLASEFVKYLASVGRCSVVQFVAGGSPVRRIRGCFAPVSV